MKPSRAEVGIRSSPSAGHQPAQPQPRDDDIPIPTPRDGGLRMSEGVARLGAVRRGCTLRHGPDWQAHSVGQSAGPNPSRSKQSLPTVPSGDAQCQTRLATNLVPPVARHLPSRSRCGLEEQTSREFAPAQPRSGPGRSFDSAGLGAFLLIYGHNLLTLLHPAVARPAAAPRSPPRRGPSIARLSYANGGPKFSNTNMSSG